MKTIAGKIRSQSASFEILLTVKAWQQRKLKALRIRPISIIMMSAVALVLTASCSRRAHPVASAGTGNRPGSAVHLESPGVSLHLPGVTVSPSEKKRLEEFINAGIENPAGRPGVSPDAIVATARGYLGVPHCMGGTTARCMDCSGLVFRVFETHGITLPHSSEEQARFGRIIQDRASLMPGDLVFFIRTYSTSRVITHSGIFAGEGRFIHTSSSQGVTITSLDDPYWKERYLFGTRIIE